MKKLIALALAGAVAATAATPAQVLARQQVVNLQDADIRAFIQDVARATGRTFVIDPRVQGKVTVASQEPLSSTELFEVLLSTLRANGLVAIPMGSGAYRIAPEEGAAQQPSTLGAGSGYGFSTQVFRLRNVDAASAAETLKPLVGGQGVVIPSPRGNLLVVADYADNLRRIRGLIAQLDQARGVTEMVTLRASSAAEMARIVNELLLPPGADANARNGVVSVVVVGSSNSLLLRGDPESVRPLVALIQDLDRRAEASGDVRVVHLQHADAESLTPVLQQLIGQTPAAGAATSSGSGLSGRTARAGAGDAEAPVQAAPPVTPAAARANIARYPGANAIIIAADPETQRMLSEVIRQLDVRRQQVLVEAVVVEVSDDVAKKLGVQFAVTGTGNSSIPFMATSYTNATPNLLALAGAAAIGDEAGSTALSQIQLNALQSLLAANGVLTGGGGRSGDALFGFIINAVKSDANSNLLSTPSILTLDNQEATILVGQEVPITTGEVLGDNNANPFRTIQRQNVGVQLEVKPQINAGGTVTLFLRQEVSSVLGPVSEQFGELVLNKREIETTINADDGEIVVLGGLLDQGESLEVEKTPLLGEIPGVGNLFKSTRRTGSKRNLMVFIRPTIVRSAADARAATARTYGYIRDLQQARYPDRPSDLDEMVRYYMQAAPPTERAAPAAAPPAVGAEALPPPPAPPQP